MGEGDFNLYSPSHFGLLMTHRWIIVKREKQHAETVLIGLLCFRFYSTVNNFKVMSINIYILFLGWLSSPNQSIRYPDIGDFLFKTDGRYLSLISGPTNVVRNIGKQICIARDVRLKRLIR